MQSKKERQRCVAKILDSFESLKKILKEKAICENDRITIFDPPFKIQILKDLRVIQLCYDDDIIATASADDFNACDGEAELILDEWLRTLTSVGYKRFLIKKKL
jgi:hypothetical protein